MSNSFPPRSAAWPRGGPELQTFCSVEVSYPVPGWETPRKRPMTAVALQDPTVTPQSVTSGADPDVALAAAGDRRAFERLYHLHMSRVYSLCARMVNDRMRA